MRGLLFLHFLHRLLLFLDPPSTLSMRPQIPLIWDHIPLFEGTWRVLVVGVQRTRSRQQLRSCVEKPRTQTCHWLETVQ